MCERDAKRLVNAVNGGILSLNQDSEFRSGVDIFFVTVLGAFGTAGEDLRAFR